MGKANSSPRYARHRIAQTYESMGIIMLNEAVGIIDMTPFHDILQKLLNQHGADLSGVWTLDSLTGGTYLL